MSTSKLPRNPTAKELKAMDKKAHNHAHELTGGHPRKMQRVKAKELDRLISEWDIAQVG